MHVNYVNALFSNQNVNFHTISSLSILMRPYNVRSSLICYTIIMQ